MKRSLKVLLCCEHFYPSVGGVQKMMQEIGSRFVLMGHDVSVVTSFREDRKSNLVEGVKIHSFPVSGNAVNGMQGPINEYQKFLVEGDFDFLLVMAAQQWTLDAMLPILDKIPYQKLHIPCGYSCFYMEEFQKYYSEMAGHLKKFDHLIYNAKDYRDINFAREHHVPHLHFIPAGASEFEFKSPPQTTVLKDLGITSEEKIYLTVGAPAYHKGHKEVLQAYLDARLPFASVLVLNGDYKEESLILSFQKNPRETLKEFGRRLMGISPHTIKKLAKKNKDINKKIIFSNLERSKLIHLFFESDLFLFASHIEYSPLVIYECLASGLPFIAGPVGNLEEIVSWTDAGVIVKASKTKEGRTAIDLKDFVQKIETISLDEKQLQSLGEKGRKAWEEKFTWGIIAEQISDLVKGN